MLVSARIILRGEYDIFRREELRSELEQADLTSDVAIDLRETVFLDAGAVALLIGLHRRLSRRTPDARVVLLNAPRLVRRVIELSNAQNLFDFKEER
jgi:anti-anti-sigma factor